jgi:hypothetical protein
MDGVPRTHRNHEPMTRTKEQYQVYTYFGRVVDTIEIPPNELHLHSLATAQRSCANYIKTTGRDAWVRLV